MPDKLTPAERDKRLHRDDMWLSLLAIHQAVKVPRQRQADLTDTVTGSLSTDASKALLTDLKEVDVDDATLRGAKNILKATDGVARKWRLGDVTKTSLADLREKFPVSSEVSTTPPEVTQARQLQRAISRGNLKNTRRLTILLQHIGSPPPGFVHLNCVCRIDETTGEWVLGWGETASGPCEVCQEAADAWNEEVRSSQEE